MSARLPAVHPLASSLAAANLVGDPRTTVGQSQKYLLSHASQLAHYGSAEELGLAAYDHPKSDADKLSWHLAEIRRVLVRALWEREIFISSIVVDELLYYEFARPGSSNPLLGVLERIRDARMTRPGLLLFPLHSFGILGAGLVHAWSASRIAVMKEKWGVALAPQTNSLSRTFTFIDEARRRFRIRERVPYDLIEHWSRSRPTKWLERNPLLAVRTVNVPGYYYDNEFLLLARVRAVTALLGMLGSLQPAEHERGETLFSSARANNWETQDIHHYIVLYATPRKRTVLNGDCVPIHSRPAITEASDLNIDLDASYWTSRRQEQADRVEAAVSIVYRGFLAHTVGRRPDNTRARVYRKLFESMTYFKRSLSASERDWQGVVSLATAFEMLLTDNYAPGVAARLARRTKLLLRGTPRTLTYQEAVKDLYDARSQIVHSGSHPASLDLHLARRAYVLTFCALCDRLGGLSPSMTSPIRDLVGDAS